MQYHDAIKELKAFADEPLEANSLNPTKCLDLRIAIRTVLKTVDGAEVVNGIGSRRGKSKTQLIPGVIDKREERKSRAEKVVDFIRENGADKGVHMLEIFKEFRINPKDMMRDIAKTYGIVSYTRDENAEITFYYFATTKREFDDGPYKGQLPKGHNYVGEAW